MAFLKVNIFNALYEIVEDEVSPYMLNLSNIGWFKEATKEDGKNLLGTIMVAASGGHLIRLDKKSSEMFLKAFNSHLIVGFNEISIKE